MFAASAAYERFMGRWSRQLAPLLVEFAGVSDGDSVLDVGSGTGALASSLTASFEAVRVTGVDASVAYVRHAAAHNRSGRVRFFVGNAQSLPLPDAAFDGALSMLALNFVPDPAAAVREMRRITRPGRVVAAAVWDYGDGMEMLRVFWDEVIGIDPAAVARDERHMPLSRRGELGALWRAGLESVEERPLVIEQAFESFDDFWSPFLGAQGPAGAYATSIPPDVRGELESRLRARLLRDAGDGPFTLRARAWAVRGVVPHLVTAYVD